MVKDREMSQRCCDGGQSTQMKVEHRRSIAGFEWEC